MIYLGIIEECDHETLIDSLKGIFETFSNEIQPFVEELMQKMVLIILNINKKKESAASQETDLDFCQLNAFETLKTLLSSEKSSKKVENQMAIIHPLLNEGFV